MSNIVLRLLLVCLGSFVLTALLGRVLIPALHALKAGQSIREIGPKWHQVKSGTPTMGTPAEADMALVYGLIGFLDDFVKVRLHRNLGLTALQKLLLQLAAALLFLWLLRGTGSLTYDLYVPFFNVSFAIPWPVYLIFAGFVIVGCVNAVNLTDGIDGLAAGVTTPVMVFFAAAAYLWGSDTLALFPAALTGGLLGFLVYNFHPAKVFMGDTGSLFLGGAVCGMAFALDMPLVLILVGIVYIVETVSVMMQVTYFKLTHGKRIFRMTPIHHHFEMGGWSEVKIFSVFTGVTVLMCLLAWLGIFHRFG